MKTFTTADGRVFALIEITHGHTALFSDGKKKTGLLWTLPLSEVLKKVRRK